MTGHRLTVGSLSSKYRGEDGAGIGPQCAWVGPGAHGRGGVAARWDSCSILNQPSQISQAGAWFQSIIQPNFFLLK